MRSLKQLKPLNHQGFTYIGILMIMAVMMVTMGTVAEVWHSVMQREKEQELLFIGNQFRNAIARYYLENGRKYPPNLEALVESGNISGKQVHFLRKIYTDPMTGQKDWGLVAGQGAGIAGIYSLSEEKPFKTTGFSDADALLEGAESYADWKFAYIPGVADWQAMPGTVVNGVVRPIPRAQVLGGVAGQVTSGSVMNGFASSFPGAQMPGTVSGQNNSNNALNGTAASVSGSRITGTAARQSISGSVMNGYTSSLPGAQVSGTVSAQNNSNNALNGNSGSISGTQVTGTIAGQTDPNATVDGFVHPGSIAQIRGTVNPNAAVNNGIVRPEARPK